MRDLSHCARELRVKCMSSVVDLFDLFLAILFAEKEVHPNSRLQPCGPMESVSGTDAEVNGSTSSMSCFNEFET